MFEAIMMFCFGVSWPLAIYRTVKVKNPVGKSLPFLAMIIIGYLSGIIHKLLNPEDHFWVIWLYLLNTLMVSADFVLVAYYRRRNAARQLRGGR